MNNLNGILLVIAAMAAFTMEDMFIKQLSAALPVGQILVLLGLGSGAVFAALAKFQGHRLFMPRAWAPLPVLRASMEAAAAVSFATSLSLADISVVAAVFQSTPLMITMGAALFLGEQVGWRRWSAILAGFAGVLMIIRPGLDGFEPSALLVLVSVLAVAARDLMTRVMDTAVPSTVVSFQAFASVVLAGGALLLLTPGEARMLAGAEWPMMAGGVLFGVMGYYGIVSAMRIGDASAVMPFRYTRLVFSMLAGILVFGERPDALTLAGAGLIIASGLYTFLRERRLARAERLAAAA
ncbi:DMT family transporter [Roseobacteraceae bacterium NS-SX3]